MASQAITAEGGTVSLPDGTRVTIPAGAVTDTLAVSLSEEGSPPAPPDYLTRIGSLVQLDLQGRRLARPGSMELPYDATKLPADVPESAVFAAYFDDAIGTWMPAGGVVDTQRHIVIVQLRRPTGRGTWSVFSVHPR